MRITNLLTRRVELRLGDDRWPIVFTHAVLLDIEEQLHISLVNGELNIVNLSAKALRAILFAALCHSGASLSAEEIGRRIGLRGLPAARNAISEAWVAAMPEREPESPRKAKKAQTRLSWMEVWANNREYLNLTDEEWLEMTPKMVQALDRAHREQVRRNELMLSRIASASANHSMCRPQKPYPDDHFMIDKWPKVEGDDGPITGENIMAQFADISPQFKKQVIN